LENLLSDLKKIPIIQLKIRKLDNKSTLEIQVPEDRLTLAGLRRRIE